MKEGSGRKFRGKKKGTHICKLCGEILTSRHKLKVHIEKIHKKVIYECPTCEKFFFDHRSLYAHKNTHDTEKKLFKCTDIHCRRSFATEEELNRHKNKSHRPEHQCDQCGKLCSSANHLREHIRTKHQAVVKKPKIVEFECPYCKISYKSKIILFYHIVNVHRNEDGFLNQCPFCFGYFKWKYEWVTHVRSSHPEAHPFHCDVPKCNQRFQTSEELSQHKSSHDEEDLRKLLIGSREEAKSQLGKFHEVFLDPEAMFPPAEGYEHLKEEPVEGNLGEVPESQTHFSSHIMHALASRKEHRVHKFDCPCGATFATYEDLNEHKHEGHTCDVCNVSFNTNGELNEHIHREAHRIEEENEMIEARRKEPYACNLGQARFRTEEELSAYIFCNLCHEIFSSRKKLEEHLCPRKSPL